jgi:fatty acid desaturase
MADGWFERDFFSEAKLLLPILAMVAVGTYLSYSHPWTAILLIGVGQQQAGWLGHDMTHARNSAYCDTGMHFVSGFINGFNRDWWSTKHNTHHVLTNHIGADPDIDLMPALFIMPPNTAADKHMRKYQHLYFLPLYSLLFVSWRSQSFQRALLDKDYTMLATSIIPGYIWLFSMPLFVAVGSVLLSGLLVAIVVTQSHEMEEFVPAGAGPQSFVETQFISTRDINCPDPITEYLFGGMQYQLTHHLFPTLPRYKNWKLQKLCMQWAKENGLTYKTSSLTECLKDHYKMMKDNSMAECAKECPAPGYSTALQEQWAK